MKCGTITGPDGKGMVHYRIRRRDHIEKIVIPIFNRIPLKTRRHLKYLIFKECFAIYSDPQKEQHLKIKEISRERELKKYKDTHPLEGRRDQIIATAEGHLDLSKNQGINTTINHQVIGGASPTGRTQHAANPLGGGGDMNKGPS